MSDNNVQNNFSRTMGIAFIFLIAYALPWVVNTPTGLSYGAYDLAEWTSLHPVVRASNPILLTSLLLRLPLVALALIIGFSAPILPFRSISWWVAGIAVLVIFMASLPPLEFFTEARADLNYQQQAATAFAALFAGVIGLMGLLPLLRPYVVIVAASFGAIMSIIGLMRAITLMQDFGLGTQASVGLLLALGAFIAFAIDGVAQLQKKGRL